MSNYDVIEQVLPYEAKYATVYAEAQAVGTEFSVFGSDGVVYKLNTDAVKTAALGAASVANPANDPASTDNDFDWIPVIPSAEFTTFGIIKRSPIITPLDYGATGYGDSDDYEHANLTIDDTNPLADTFAAAFAEERVVDMGGRSYLTGAHDLSVANANMPDSIRGEGSRLIAKDILAGPLLQVTNTHQSTANKKNRFFLTGLDIDCDNKAETGFKMFGGQFADIDVAVRHSTGVGAHIQSGAGAGVYYGKFSIAAADTGSHGIVMDSLDGTYRNAAQTMRLIASNCNGYGVSLDYVQGQAFISAELCVNAGFYVGHTRDMTVNGGYNENSHVGPLGGPVDGTSDVGMEISEFALGFKLIGGRHIGEIVVARDATGKPPNGYSVDTTTKDREFERPTTYWGEATFNAPVKGGLSGAVAVLGNTDETIATRDQLGEDATYIATNAVTNSGSLRQTAVITTRGTGVATLPTISDIVAPNVQLQFTIDTVTGDLRISNTSGTDRNTDYSLLRIL